MRITDSTRLDSSGLRCGRLGKEFPEDLQPFYSHRPTLGGDCWRRFFGEGN